MAKNEGTRPPKADEPARANRVVHELPVDLFSDRRVWALDHFQRIVRDLGFRIPAVPIEILRQLTPKGDRPDAENSPFP